MTVKYNILMLVEESFMMIKANVLKNLEVPVQEVISAATSPFMLISRGLLIKNGDYYLNHRDSALHSLIKLPEPTHLVEGTPSKELFYLLCCLSVFDDMLKNRLNATAEELTALEVAEALVSVAQEIHSCAKAGKWPEEVYKSGEVCLDAETKIIWEFPEIKTKTQLFTFLKEYAYFPSRIMLSYSNKCDSCGGHLLYKHAMMNEGVLTIQEEVDVPFLAHTTHTCISLEKEPFWKMDAYFPTGKMHANDFFREENALDDCSSAVWRAFVQSGVSLSKLGSLVLSRDPVDTTGWGLDKITNKYATIPLDPKMGMLGNISLYEALGVYTSFGGNATGYVWQKGNTVIVSLVDKGLGAKGFKNVGSFSMRYWWASVIDDQHLNTIISKACALSTTDKEYVYQWNKDNGSKVEYSDHTLDSEGVCFDIEPGNYYVLSALEGMSKRHPVAVEQLAFLGEKASDIAAILKSANEWVLAFIPKN